MFYSILIDLCSLECTECISFKLFRRFLFGKSPFFLQSSTAHLSAAFGFLDISNSRFRFLFRSGASQIRPVMANWVVAISTCWYWANDPPVVEHCGIKSLRGAGNVTSHLNEVVGNWTIYPLNRGGPDIGGVIETTWNLPA